MASKKEQIFSVFDDFMANHVDWRIGSSFRKYATARDDLIQAFSEKTGISTEEFSNHLAKKLAKRTGVF